MREVSVEFLRSEIIRVRAIVTQTRVFHYTGTRLHAAGNVLAILIRGGPETVCFRARAG